MVMEAKWIGIDFGQTLMDSSPERTYWMIGDTSKELGEPHLVELRCHRWRTMKERYGTWPIIKEKHRPELVSYVFDDRPGAGEIFSVIELLGPEGCEETLSLVNFKGMSNYLLTLRSLSNFDIYFKFIINNYDQLCNKAKMKRLLKKCYDSPGSLLPATLSDVPQNVWLYLYLSSIFKAKAGKILAFGYANIASGDKAEGISKGYIKLADWLNRKKRTK